MGKEKIRIEEAGESEQSATANSQPATGLPSTSGTAKDRIATREIRNWLFDNFESNSKRDSMTEYVHLFFEAYCKVNGWIIPFRGWSATELGKIIPKAFDKKQGDKVIPMKATGKARERRYQSLGLSEAGKKAFLHFTPYSLMDIEY